MSEVKHHEGAATQQQQQSQPQKQGPSSRTRPSTSESGWFSIPAPLARLFKKFPLLTYPPNELPARSPQQRDVATLYVFISDADALKGLPSYNPTCLKWQTFLRLAGIKDLQLAPSNNHASPNGALPFLIPAISNASASTSTSTGTTAAAPSIISSNKLEQYALSYAARATTNTTTTSTITKFKPNQPTPVSDISASQNHRLESYTALLDHAVRNAWLYALYLDPANTELLRHWYIQPTSSAAVVQTTTLYQLRAAAEAEILKSSGGGGGGGGASSGDILRVIYSQASRSVGPADSKKESNKLYEDARRAFGALATCLEEQQSAGGGGGGAGGGGWFFGAEAPGVFDAAVFAYTHLILLDPAAAVASSGCEAGWGDRTLADIVREFPALVRHRDRVYERCWGSN
ncbi:uncharacterized protein B0I36DRAFT_365519 [Microdochium trichocladiopsis]|uniref:Thioredoxin-like fold domain-containing protein n=1 Tax=Microdochium trichocladiopsis TaxID=1682393 RepID=A0A9P8Y2A6_9PEZI|nr:uncharacterized protein B0I36DRAFT_365519 [Microdochium trichocladiopsis]KAH7025868.1 hypothetical protein B0I36DRAFT_365519 [Microdochium trichocladiopsis]